MIYDELMPDLKAEYHTLVADALATRDGTRVEDRSGSLTAEERYFLARHHLAGRCPSAAVPHLEPALEYLKFSHRNEESLALIDRALATEGLLDPPARVRQLLHSVPLLSRVGRVQELEATLAEALRSAEECGDMGLQARARDRQASFLHRVGRQSEALRAALRARRLARRARDRGAEGRTEQLLVWLVRALAPATNPEVLRIHLDRARALQEAAGNEVGVALVELDIASHEDLTLSGEQARRRIERVHDRAVREGRLDLEGLAVHQLGEHHAAVGRWGEAFRWYGRSLELARSTGARSSEAVALANVGFMLANFGAAEEARASLEKCRAMSREIGHAHVEAYATYMLGYVAWIEGDLRDARAETETALQRWKDAGDRGHAGLALTQLCRLHRAAGETEAAAACVQGLIAGYLPADPPTLFVALAAALPGGDVARAKRILEKYGPGPVMDQRLGVEFCMWQATGDPSHLEAAHRHLEYLRDHTPEAYRVSMMENVPLHREVARAWEQREREAEAKG